VAFTGWHKTVTVTVDGQSRQVRTFAGDVAGVLDRAGVTVGEHGTVSPRRKAPIQDGSTIVVRHGRRLAMTLDGDQRAVWVTARRVGGALDQLGITATGAYVSLPRSHPIPRSGLALTVRLPQQVALVAGGHTRTVTTTAPTVRRLLADAHVAVDGNDLVSEPLGAYPTTGMTVRAVHVVVRRHSQRVSVSFDTVRRNDPSRYQGDSTVVRAGRPGAREVTKKVTYHDGKKVAAKTVGKELVKKPTDKIIEVGTKKRPVSAPAPAATSTPSPAHRSTGSSGSSGSTSSSGLDWAAVARCESGGNPRAVSPGGRYRGLYQFSLSTWHSVGGSGDPINASAAEQTHRAQLLYARTGASSWPVCGHHL
jgi:uncharacterized protein YabE (DUF348 family)